MASKYDKVFKEGNLQRWEQSNTRSKELVDKIGELVENNTKAEIAERYKIVKRRKDRLEELSKVINFEAEALEAALCTILEANGEDSFKLSSGGSFSANPSIYPTVEDEEAFRQWCIENGYEKDLKMHSKKLQSVCGELLIDGEDVPPGIKVFTKMKLSARGIKEKN